MAKTPRGEILTTALNLTEGDRNKTYGPPRKNLACFASLIRAYLSAKSNVPFTIGAIDAAVIMCLIKISRIAANPKHQDNYIDLAAYAAIAGELAGEVK